MTRHIGVIVFVVIGWLATAQPLLAQQTSDLPPGWVTPTPLGLFAEPTAMKKLINATDGLVGDADARDGPYAELGHMITGAGWISAGPGYRTHILQGRAVVDASATVSWNLYRVAQGRFELPRLAHDRLAMGGQAMYQDVLQVDYFGVGNTSSEANESAYRFNNSDLLAYATFRARPWLSVSARAGWIPQPTVSTATGLRHITIPNTIDRFTESTAPGLSAPPPMTHGDVSVAADWRDHASHPSRGGLYRATVAAYSDRDTGLYSFRRYEVEASQFIPLNTPKWVVALHGWEVFSDTVDGHVVPFYLLPSLGGQNTLRGYTDYRFHDRDMQNFNAESRWAIFGHLDAAAFVDVGKVASHAGDLDFRGLKRSYGAGLRVHNATSTLARLDVGHSSEGWRVFFKMSDPFKRTTPAFGRSSVVPFVP
ncbi:MAG TPA: BamA/TamA family outer membrane protein [Vicinamibacterales bacterium]|nr:BamA/TamA family outer membrane protein [Vicinamibacterales bacterium]